MLYPILLYPYITKDNFIVVLPPIASVRKVTPFK